MCLIRGITRLLVPGYADLGELRRPQTGLLETLRKPFEPASARRLGHASLVRRAQLAVLRRYESAFEAVTRNFVLPDGTLGVSSTGNLNAETLRELLGSLPDHGTWELCCHPGYHDADLTAARTRLRGQREIEREALLRALPERLSLPNAPELIHYGDLRAYGDMRKIGTGHEEF